MNLSLITAQQAPWTLASRQTEVSAMPDAEYGTDQCALSRPHSKKPTAQRRISTPSTTVTTEEPMELNRLTRAQPSGPAPAINGGGRVVSGAAATPARAGTGSRAASEIWAVVVFEDMA